MTSNELVLRIDAAASAVPGVRRLFAAERIPLTAVRQVTAAADEPVGLSAAREHDGGLEITVSVELDGTRPAAETAADVASAVLGAVGGTAAVHVRVSRVAGGGAGIDATA
jgi:hypothetical protein